MSYRYYSPNQDISFKMTSPAEETELFGKARAGDQAASDFLITNHLLFAAMLATKLARGGLPNDEVVSAANVAVMDAFKLFDPSLGFRFSTYLRPFVRGAVASLWKDRLSNPVANVEPGMPDPVNNVPDTAPTVEEIDFSEYCRELVAEAISKLDPLSAELIRLRYMERKSFSEIGKLRKLGRATIFAQHKAILKRLKQSLKRMELGE